MALSSPATVSGICLPHAMQHDTLHKREGGSPVFCLRSAAIAEAWLCVCVHGADVRGR